MQKNPQLSCMLFHFGVNGYGASGKHSSDERLHGLKTIGNSPRFSRLSLDESHVANVDQKTGPNFFGQHIASIINKR